MQKIDFGRILRFVPFSYMWILHRIADNPKTVLDIGCGNGEIMRIIAEKGWNITGIDIHGRSLKEAERTRVYSRLIKGDVVLVTKKMLRKKQKFDLVFCSQLIEHITHRKGEDLLELSEKLAKKKIFFGTPNGFMHQPEIFIKGNPHQHHKSGWTISEFEGRGYTVKGVGFMPIWSENGLGRTKNTIFEIILTATGFLISPIVYFFPQIAAGILATKIISNE